MSEVVEERPRYLGAEVLAVLGVSLGMSAIFTLLGYVRAELTVPGGVSNTTATVVAGRKTEFQWLDFADQLSYLLNAVVPVGLALVLLARYPGGRGFGIGFDLSRWRREGLLGLGFCALIGIPGLFVVWAAHQLDISATLAVVNFPDVWYRIPVLALDALQNGLLEEVVMIGYLLTRLGQLGWPPWLALAVSALIRGTYHLYQGDQAFVGNAVMGVLFGLWFLRTRRVLPLVVAHVLLDAFSFFGYLALHERLDWI